MNHAHQPALFSSAITDSPVVFSVKSNPRVPVKHQLTFLFNAGQVSLSKGVIELLGAEDSRRITFVNYRGNAYVTRSDNPEHFWLNLRSREASGIYSGYIQKKQFVQASLRQLGYGIDDEVSFPVAPHQVKSSELNLDPEQFPYPLYRICADSKVGIGV